MEEVKEREEGEEDDDEEEEEDVCISIVCYMAPTPSSTG